jgi:hypothetical protein
MVEATESCDINRGKCSKQSKVHKIRKTSFVNLYHDCHDLKIREAMCGKFVERNGSNKFFNHSAATKFCVQNGKAGKGDVFSSTKRLYCLIFTQSFAQKLSTCYSRN